MVRVLQNENLIIIYSKHFLVFEWKLEKSDLRTKNILKSSEFNIGGEKDAFLEIRVDACDRIYLFLHNPEPMIHGRNMLAIFDKKDSCLHSYNGILDLTSGRAINLLPFISEMPPSTKYPIIISYSAISSISALSKEANAVHENRMSDELSENRMSELSSDLQKILEEALDTDTVLSVDGEDIKAHRVLLQARSPVFRKMFQHDSMEASNSTIVISDIGSATMKRLVKFLYTGMMEKCDFDETLELYYAADKYEVLSLREDCRRELPKNLDVNNACSLFILANRHNDEELKEKVVKFVSDNYRSVVNTESFMEMSKEDMGSLVRLCAAGKE